MVVVWAVALQIQCLTTKSHAGLDIRQLDRYRVRHSCHDIHILKRIGNQPPDTDVQLHFEAEARVRCS